MKNPYRGKALYYRLFFMITILIGIGIFSALFVSSIVKKGYELESEQKINLYSDFIESRLSAYDKVDTIIENALNNELILMANYLFTEKAQFSDVYFEEIVEEFGVTTIAWVNNLGVTIAASDPIFFNYQIDENHVLWDFFSGPETVFIEGIRESFIFNNTPYKYANFKDEQGYMLQIGVEVADYNTIFAELTLQSIIMDIFESSSILYAKFIDSNSIIIAHSKTELIGVTEIEEHLILANTNQQHISHTHVHELEGLYTYSIATPIYVEDTYIGMLDIGFDPNYVVPIIRNINLVTLSIATILTIILLLISLYGAKARSLMFEVAFMDSLTGLYTKQALDYTLSETPVKQNLKNMGYFLLNIDNYRSMISIHGDSVINHIIKVLSERLISIYDSKYIFKVSAEEFLILCQSQNHDFIEKRLRETKSFLASDIRLNDLIFNVQLTVAIIEQSNDMTYPEIYKNLNIVMREAKLNSKGGHLFYDDHLIQKIKRRHFIEDNLKAILSTDGHEALFAVYQPQVSTTDGSIGCFEVLSRLDLSHYGFIPPMEFIRIAEGAGLIQSLGQYVLKQVAKFHHTMVKMGVKPIPVSINVSMIEIMQKDFSTEFVEQVDKLGIPHDCIQVEITETVLATNFIHLKDQLVFLRSQGIKISIDDFGTGYSSLSYLKIAPIDFIKLDKVFIDELNSNGEAYTLTEAVINIAHKLNAKVVAEEVETQMQINKLNMMACDYIQGYYFSKPLKLLDAIEYIKKQK